MTLDSTTISLIILGAYKITCLIVGIISIHMGYKLFRAGIWGEAGDLNAKFGNNKLVLKNAAPGTFFALFGAIIISFTIYKGYNDKSYIEENGQQEKRTTLEDDDLLEIPEYPFKKE